MEFLNQFFGIELKRTGEYIKADLLDILRGKGKI